ncbi:Uncharacterised protein [Mycobacterium tuberculosis]|uniref:Uncharacterized protein n=1 Tax=Mycobacterium tuberculosis TaxID=1773 RepID=A0A655APR8_MYCTX|nr:Uncharacterised protein [Mycobacterium tuberculosis]
MFIFCYKTIGFFYCKCFIYHKYILFYSSSGTTQTLNNIFLSDYIDQNQRNR